MNRFLTRLFVSTVVVGFAAAWPALAGSQKPEDGGGEGGELTCSTCVTIDTFNANNTTTAPKTGSSGSPFPYTEGGWVLPATNGVNGASVGVLSAGKPYLVTITGTSSYWSKASWEYWGATGQPEAAPKYPSNDVPQADQGKTGLDWECVWGVPSNPTGKWYGISYPTHYPQRRFSVDGGATFVDLTPIGPQCAPDHVYKYLVYGQGSEAFFRIVDPNGPTTDNYGKYKICVQAVTVCGPNQEGCDNSHSSVDEHSKEKH